jgi:alkylhydroperoxidase family enzyme
VAVMSMVPDVRDTAGATVARGVARRTLTPDNIVRTVANLAIAFPIIVRSVFRPKTSKSLREKLMLGVTAINDARFCKWGHTHWAFSQGVSLEEVNQILGNTDDALAGCEPAEVAAIRFGQRYAMDLHNVDLDLAKDLREFYDQAQIRELLGFVFFITFTNLSGNTVDLVLDRIRGRGRPLTVFEGVVGTLLAPILLILVLLVKTGKLFGVDKRRAARHRIQKI